MLAHLDLLIKSVKDILQTEKLLKQEKEKRGECFNIFEIMKAQSDEVHTHSALIACLLNPKGNHGCGKAFLEAFLDIIKQCRKDGTEPDYFFEDTSEVCTYEEYNIGGVSDDFEYGGRIDILLENSVKDGKQAIIIENKIYAQDGEKQLYRYKKHAEQYKKYIILYLTLDGHAPAECSTKGGDGVMKEGKDFYCISYREHIIDWLKCCKEKAASIPVVRETITQYLDLILKLTHQNMENTTKEDLMKLLATKENYSVVSKIHDVYWNVIESTINVELRRQIEDVAKNLNLTCRFNSWGSKRAYESQFLFEKEEWKYFHIKFEFLGKNFSNWIYGIAHRNQADLTNTIELDNVKKEVVKAVEGDWKHSQWYICYKSFIPDNLNTDEAIEQIYNGTIKENIKTCVEKILECISKIEKAGHF